MSPIGHDHEEYVDRLLNWRVDNLDSASVRIQESLGLPELESVESLFA